MSIESVDNYIKSRCFDARTGFDDYRGFVHDALCFDNNEARLLVDYLIELERCGKNETMKVASLCLKVTDIIKEKLLETHGENANEYEREQRMLISDAVMKEISKGEAA